MVGRHGGEDLVCHLLGCGFNDVSYIAMVSQDLMGRTMRVVGYVASPIRVLSMSPSRNN
jgi:hypothetical protein